jgi:hypothetical protein
MVNCFPARSTTGFSNRDILYTKSSALPLLGTATKSPDSNTELDKKFCGVVPFDGFWHKCRSRRNAPERNDPDTLLFVTAESCLCGFPFLRSSFRAYVSLFSNTVAVLQYTKVCESSHYRLQMSVVPRSHIEIRTYQSGNIESILF